MSWLAPNMVPCAHPCRSCMPTLARRPLCRGELEASKRTQQPQVTILEVMVCRQRNRIYCYTCEHCSNAHPPDCMM